MAKASLIWVEAPGLEGLDPKAVAREAGLEFFKKGDHAAVVSAPTAYAEDTPAEKLEPEAVVYLDLAAELGGGENRASRAAVALARAAALLEEGASVPEDPGRLPVRSQVLVAGGGMSALAAAIQAAELGHEVTLAVPGDDEGMPAAGEDAQAVAQLAESLPESVEVLTETEVVALSGAAGDFTATCVTPEGEVSADFGAVILAPTGYLEPADLPAFLDEDQYSLASLTDDIEGPVAVMAGYAAPISSASFEQALATAIALKEQGNAVFMFFQEARVATQRGEQLYTQAREQGVLCTRVNPGQLKYDNGVLSWKDHITGETMTAPVEYFVVADRPAAEAPACLSNRVLWPELDELVPERARLMGGQTVRPGLYLLGPVVGTPAGQDRLEEAAATVADLHQRLTRPVRSAGVNESLCVRCLTCVRVCKQGAPRYQDGRIRVAPAACILCGLCASECPGQAIWPEGQATPEALNALQTAMEMAKGPQRVLFACSNSALPALAGLTAQGRELPDNLVVFPVGCAGRVGQRLILEALSLGAEKVLVAGCHLENCFSQTGNQVSSTQSDFIDKTLGALGVEVQRVSFLNLASNQSARLDAALKEMGV